MADQTTANTNMNYIHALLFVVVYVALGYLLKLDANVYLLIGIPLAIVFQLFVRKQPLYKLWVRDSSDFRFGKLGVALALVFVIEPIRQIVVMCMHGKPDAVVIIYLSVAIVGAFAAGFGFSRFNRKVFKQLLLCVLIAGGIGIGLMLLTAFATSIAKGEPMHFNFKKGISSLLIYIPVCFVMEEVVFRGMLDTHVNPQQNPKDILSALFVSVLWGLWHLPTYHGSAANLPLVATTYIIVHSLVGVPLSIFWRRSGNLGTTAFTHAFIDAIRNALL